jgi:hypothetical protein
MSTKIIVPTILATVNPTASDDRSTGMHVGFRWLNTTTPAEFVCTNDAAGAAVWSSVGGGGGGAPTTSQYVTLATDGTLTNERVLTAGSNISLVDGGAGNALTVNAQVYGGPVRQIKDSMDETDRSTTSTTYVASGMTITLNNPLQESGNKVRVRFLICVSASAVSTLSFTIKRGSTFITPAGSDNIVAVGVAAAQVQQNILVEIYDTPNTTTPQTYELWYKISTGTLYCNYVPTTGYASPTIMTIEELSPNAPAIITTCTNWTDAGAMTIGATTTPPTKGTTTVDKVYWRRVGDSMEVRLDYRQGAAGAAGSGSYLITIPGGYSIDSGKVTFNTTLADSIGAIGLAIFGVPSVSNGIGSVIAYDATRVGIQIQTLGAFGSSFKPLSTANQTFSAVFTVPIVGWSVADANPAIADLTFRYSNNLFLAERYN